MRLKNKVVIITGAGSGIGRETALLFAKEGAKVVVADVNEKGGEETAAGIKEIGGEGFFDKSCVTNREELKHLVKDCLEKYGRIDVLINNAAIIQDALVSKMTEEQWESVVNVNLKGAFNCIQAVVEVMINQGHGVIVNAASIVGMFGKGTREKRDKGQCSSARIYNDSNDRKST